MADHAAYLGSYRYRGLIDVDCFHCVGPVQALRKRLNPQSHNGGLKYCGDFYA